MLAKTIRESDLVSPALEMMSRSCMTASHLGAGCSAFISSRPTLSYCDGMNEQEIRARLREWVLAHSKTGGGEGFSDQTPLLQTGMLSSLDIVEFVLFIEELRGEDVETDDIEPEVFTSIDSIWKGLFAVLG